MSINTNIMGVEIHITLSTDSDRRGRRIGSVPILDQDGKKYLLRVYGALDRPFSPLDRIEFEKAVRAFCARPETVESLIGRRIGVIPVRFNPSEALLMTGWRNKGSTVVH